MSAFNERLQNLTMYELLFTVFAGLVLLLLLKLVFNFVFEIFRTVNKVVVLFFKILLLLGLVAVVGYCCLDDGPKWFGTVMGWTHLRIQEELQDHELADLLDGLREKLVQGYSCSDD
ncbi:MAG: hypothetical protein Q9212_002833 [Teloschistes hypoglaucus]